MKTYIYLFDEGCVRDEYNEYVVISPNYVNTINALMDAHKQFKVLEDCWTSEDEVNKDKLFIDHIKGELLNYLSDELNQYHHTTFDRNEWKIVLSAWLGIYVTNFYEKYKRIKKIRMNEPDYEIETFDKSIYPMDYAEFEKLILQSKEFNAQIYLDIIDCCKYIHVKNKIIKANEHKFTPLYKKTIGYYKFNCYRFLLRSITKLNNKNINVVMNDSYLPFSFLNRTMLQSKFRIFNFQEDYLRHEGAKIKYNTIDIKWRSPAQNLELEDEFFNIVARYVKKYTPVAYLEGFDYLSKAQENWFGELKNLKAALYICYGITYDELYKNFLIHRKHKDNKLKLIDIQHGGNYGIDCTQLMQLEYDISDYIYTWGYEYRIENCITKRMPAAKLINLKLDRKKADGTILYVSYSYFKDFTMLESNLVFYKKSIRQEINFLKNIKKTIQDKMVVRLHPNERMWGLKFKIQTEMPNIKFDSIADYYSSLEIASLVICSDWNTTCMEALYAGVPFVILKPVNAIEETARDVALKMKDYGLLVESWEDLLKFVNKMTSEDKIHEWWSNASRANFVKYLKDSYVYGPANAEEIWGKELLRLCADHD